MGCRKTHGRFGAICGPLTPSLLPQSVPGGGGQKPQRRAALTSSGKVLERSCFVPTGDFLPNVRPKGNEGLVPAGEIPPEMGARWQEPRGGDSLAELGTRRGGEVCKLSDQKGL